jgi:acetyl esterase/lipase
VHPRQLVARDCLGYAYRARSAAWQFRNASGEEEVVMPEGRLHVTNADALVPLLLAGQGIAELPEFIAGEYLQDGRLVSLLGDWAPRGAGLYLVTPTARRARRKSKYFRNFWSIGYRRRRGAGRPYSAEASGSSSSATGSMALPLGACGSPNKRSIVRQLKATLICIAVLFVSGCSGIGFLNDISPRGDYVLKADLAYGEHSQKLDVYQPRKALAKTPVIVFLYGGSWQQGETYPKDQYRFVAEALVARGYLVVVPDYRLYPDVKFPGFVEDCASAVVWAHANAAAYGGDPDRLVVMGHSAGAYNAAMLALEPEFLRSAGGDRRWLRAMIGLAGPYDFLPLTDPALISIFEPAKPLQRSQPIDHVDGHAPPMLLLAGNDDTVVYPKNTRNLAAAIRAKGGTVEAFIYPSMSHTKIVATTATRLQGYSDVMDRVAKFMDQYDAATR